MTSEKYGNSYLAVKINVEIFNQMKDMKIKFQQQIGDACIQLTEKIERVDAMVSVFSHDLVKVREDACMLK